MEVLGAVLAIAIVAFGGVLVLLGVRGRLAVAGDATAYLQGLDAREEHGDVYDQVLAEPFVGRIVRPLGVGTLRRIASLTPANHVANVHRQLVLGGVASSVRAEELVALEVLGAGFGVVLALLYAVLGGPSPRIGVLLLVALPLVGALAPQSWLKRRVAERTQSIRNDLPDTIDLMAISVE
ncbi:MAG: hypothetical protein KY431_10065, partial [Actinobacteria bacterium]|nr:hypothetical protein [Actinomycetota bacterium]